MSAHVSRRTVATGAAWAVPVLAVGAAAPAMAASACPTLDSVSGVHTNGASTVELTITWTDTLGSWCVTSVQATGGANGGVTLTFAGIYSGTTAPNCGTGSVTIPVTTSDNGQNNKGLFTGTITLSNGTQHCTLTATDFQVTNA